MRQHYLLGYEFRNRYILQTPLLSANYSAKEVYLRSTDVNRTLMSAYSQLQGLYPDGTGPSLAELSLQATSVPPLNISNLANIEAELGIAALPSFMQSTPIHTDKKSTDVLLRSQDNCKLVVDLIDTSNKDEDYAICGKYSSSMQTIMNYFNCTFQQACDMADNLQGSLVANSFCGYPIPTELSDPTFIQNLRNFHNETFNLQYSNPPIVAELITTPYMSLLNQTFSAVSTSPQDLKFIFLSAHDSTLVAFIHGLQLNTTVFPVYASTLITELHLINGAYFVRMLYNDVDVVVPDCKQTFCPLETFLGYLNKRIIPNMQQVCSSSAAEYSVKPSPVFFVVLFSGGGVLILLYAFAMRRKKQDRLLEIKAV
jgi:hypothetical protein